MWLFKHFLRIMNTEVAFSSFITPGHYITVNFFPFQGYPLFWNMELVSLHSFASLKVRVRLVVSKHTHEFGCTYHTHWLGCKWYKNLSKYYYKQGKRGKDKGMKGQRK
jgi:glycosyltransferase involved in cell wall biosynthesis